MRILVLLIELAVLGAAFTVQNGRVTAFYAAKPSVALRGWFDDAADRLLGPSANLGAFDDALATTERTMDAIAAEAYSRDEEARLANGFDGFALRQILNDKWGEDYDVELTRLV